MQRRVIPAAALCGALVLTACSGDLPAAPGSLTSPGGPALGAAGAPIAQAASPPSTVPMLDFVTKAPLSGTSAIVRTDNGFSWRVHANGLTPGHAYTIWVAIYNEPEDCDGPCDEFDVVFNRGVPSFFNGVGHVVGGSGRGNFGGHVSVGNPVGPDCSLETFADGCGPGLLDARTAEVQLALRSHGPPIPGQVREQLSSFLGGCGENDCATVQLARHEPD